MTTCVAATDSASATQAGSAFGSGFFSSFPGPPPKASSTASHLPRGAKTCRQTPAAAEAGREQLVPPGGRCREVRPAASASARTISALSAVSPNSRSAAGAVGLSRPRRPGVGVDVPALADATGEDAG